MAVSYGGSSGIGPRNRQQWLQLARLVAARASGHGTGQQILSAFYPYIYKLHTQQG